MNGTKKNHAVKGDRHVRTDGQTERITVNHELEATANVFEEDGFYLVVVTISFTFSSIPNMLTLNTPFKRA